MSRLLNTLARTVSRIAPGSVSAVLVMDGGEYPVRGTWLRETRWAKTSGDENGSEELTVVSRIAIPTERLPRLPDSGDELRIEGQVLYASYVLDLGTTVHVGLARWRA